METPREKTARQTETKADVRKNLGVIRIRDGETLPQDRPQ